MSTPISSDATTAVRKMPPGPRGRPLVGSMFDFLSTPLNFILQVAQQYGDVAHYRIANTKWYQINHPDGIQRVLQENHHNYSKGSMTRNVLRPLGGDGLFISEGDHWLRQRRLMQPAFHRKRIAAFGDLMVNTTLQMLARWQPSIATQQPLEIADEMTRLTMEIVTAALFSTHVSEDTSRVSQAITTVMEDATYRFRVPFYPPGSVPTPRNRRRRAALHTLDQTVYRIIQERSQQQEQRDDLLGLLMEARDEDTGEGMSDQQLRDEVITLFIAGHETTAIALTWTWYLLSQHAEVRQRLSAEIDQVLGERPPTVTDLPELQYTRMVIDEAMRLYPPAWITNRQAIADDEICGYHIPAGSFVAISPYVLHRHPAWWDEPERFDPERFAQGAPAERSANRPRFAYFPFGGGPRLCIGQGFALTEAVLVLATIAQHYDLRVIPGHKVAPQALATLRPRGSLPMHVVERTA